MTVPPQEPRGAASTRRREMVSKNARIGIDLCRRGLWRGGLTHLSLVETEKGGGQAIPGLALSYFGYGIASREGRLDEGLRYCREGVDREVWQAENHLNLARTLLLAGKLKQAIAALDYGLAVEPDNQAILELRRGLGTRKRPLFPFLARGHALNRVAGQLRHRLTQRQAASQRGTAVRTPS